MSKSIFIKLLICIMFTTIILTNFYLPLSHATNIFSSAKEFLKDGDPIENVIDESALQNTSNTIYNILLGLAIMVAVIVGMVIGIQFMVASADEKAKVKEALLPYIVGCIIVFGSFTIWKIAVNIGNDVEDEIGKVEKMEIEVLQDVNAITVGKLK